MPVADYYNTLLSRSSTCFENLASDAEALTALNRSHNFALDYEKLLQAIDARPDAQMLRYAIREYQFSLYAAATANYRQAFTSLWLFFELSLATIHFSAYEIRFRKWLLNKQDIVWSSLIDAENGVFAKSFIEAFNPDLASSSAQYSTLAGTVYRECSEYVHGNINTHAELDLPISFEKSTFMTWQDKTETVRLCIVFVFAARFILFLTPEKLNDLEPIMTDTLGTLAGIQAIYAVKK